MPIVASSQLMFLLKDKKASYLLKNVFKVFVVKVVTNEV
jgi:hypothetical protein